MSKWTEEELLALEDPDQWEPGEIVEPVPPEQRGAVVAVRFNREEFRQIAHAAERAGVRLTAYIHDAALERSAASPKEQAAHRANKAKP
jgi:hypothetical protein